MPAVVGGWDPVQIEETWSVYDTIDATRALSIKAHITGLVMKSAMKKG